MSGVVSRRCPAHLGGKPRVALLEAPGDVVADLRLLVLAQLGAGIESVHPKPEPHSALGSTPGAGLVLGKTAPLGLVPLEVIREPGEDRIVLLVIEDLRVP